MTGGSVCDVISEEIRNLLTGEIRYNFVKLAKVRAIIKDVGKVAKVFRC